MSTEPLYIQPSSVTIREDSRKTPLVLCGLRSTKHANADSFSIPSTYIIWGALLLLSILALGWPFLKMSYVSPKQRIPLKQFLLLIFMMLLAGSLLTLGALNWTYNNLEEAESREHLKKLADRINSQVTMELTSALQELDQLSAPQSLTSLRPSKEDKTKWDFENFEPNYLATHEKLYTDPAAKRYPWFQFAFWADGKGSQIAKIAADYATPPVDISKHDYFKQIACGVPNVPAACDGLDTLSVFKFRVYPVNSPNTGEFAVVIASPIRRGTSLIGRSPPGTCKQSTWRINSNR